MEKENQHFHSKKPLPSPKQTAAQEDEKTNYSDESTAQNNLGLVLMLVGLAGVIVSVFINSEVSYTIRIAGFISIFIGVKALQKNMQQ